MEEDVEEVDKEIDVGEAPPIADLAPEQAPVHCRQLCWQWLEFGWVVEATRWLGRALAQGPGLRCPPYRQSSRPWPRWMKSWLASSRRKSRQQRKPAKEEMQPPWRW